MIDVFNMWIDYQNKCSEINNSKRYKSSIKANKIKP